MLNLYSACSPIVQELESYSAFNFTDVGYLFFCSETLIFLKDPKDREVVNLRSILNMLSYLSHFVVLLDLRFSRTQCQLLNSDMHQPQGMSR